MWPLQTRECICCRETETEPSNLPFRPPRTPLAGESLVAGDFNGDGKLDLAYLGTGSSVTLLFGNGDGTFQPELAIGGEAGAPIVTADFNRDGRVDFAVANQIGGVTVYLGGQQSGLNVSSSHFGAFTAGATGRYQITVTNLTYAMTTGTVTVKDALPAGLTAASIGGTGWTCTLNPLQCTRSDVLSTSSSYPAITLAVNVAATL